jgi:CHAD domain-containing protein
LDNKTQPLPPSPEIAPIEKKETSVCDYAAGIFVKSSNAMDVEIDGVRKGRDIEFIHRLRVASRRLRTSLDVFVKCVPAKKKESWRIRVKALTQALGETRDTDVQILLLESLCENLPDPRYRTGMRRLLLRLRQRRTKLQKQVLDALDSLEKKKVLNQIRNKFKENDIDRIENNFFCAEIYRLAFTSISTRLDEFLSYEVYLQNPEYIKELHQMRIAAKQLRYALEIFAPIFPDQLADAVKSTRQAQQVLGEIHDCDVWDIYLPEFIEREKDRLQHYLGQTRSLKLLLPGIEFFQKNREEERKRLFADYQKTWRKWRKSELWLNLRRSLLAFLPTSENQ